MNKQLINPVRHGLMLGIFALIAGASWAAYMATHHGQLHGAFEAQQQAIQQQHMQDMMQDLAMDDMSMDEHAHDANTPANHHQQQAGHAHAGHGHEAGAQHSHSGSLATDAMQRLLRGHIHAMGLGILSCVLLLIVALTTLKDCWKKVFGFTFGLGAVLYPPAWVIMGFRTVELGPEAAEASIMWLFGPAVGLLLGSMVALLVVLSIEMMGWHKKGFFARFFQPSA
ncbi:MAG: hypothetical protein R8M45_05305, partial [Ghiorsea sp.]